MNTIRCNFVIEYKVPFVKYFFDQLSTPQLFILIRKINCF